MPSDASLSCVCGEPLAETVDEDEVVTTEGERVPFRRNTDFIVCPACLSMYRVADLQRGEVRPVTDFELDASIDGPSDGGEA